MTTMTTITPTRRRRDTTRCSLLSNHGHVLACICADPTIRLRDIAQRVGVTERSAATLVKDLEGTHMIERVRVGRRNHYRVDAATALQHRVPTGSSAGSLLHALAGERPVG